MSFTEFIAGLKKLNPKIRVFPGPRHIAGLYLFMPKNPIANQETGLKHLGAMPSPRFFNTLPKHDFWDDALGGFNRGWTSVLRYLCELRFGGIPVIHRELAIARFGDFYSYAPSAKRIEKTWIARKRLRAKYPVYNSSDYDKVMKKENRLHGMIK